jgi:hypothetical protein
LSRSVTSSWLASAPARIASASARKRRARLSVMTASEGDSHFHVASAESSHRRARK